MLAMLASTIRNRCKWLFQSSKAKPAVSNVKFMPDSPQNMRLLVLLLLSAVLSGDVCNRCKISGVNSRLALSQ
eukprot:4916434-Prorocentrum_lima.AAC.1